MKKIILIVTMSFASICFASNEQVEKIQNSSKLKFGVEGNIGQRSFTGTQSDIYESGSTIGASFSYLINSHTAVQASFSSGKNAYSFSSSENTGSVSGSSEMQSLSLHGKYFLKSKNLNAKFNPYAIGGFSQITRKTTISGQPLISGNTEAAGVDLGVGAEFLFNKKKNFINIQFMYNGAEFDNDSSEIALVDANEDIVNTGVRPSGNPMTLQIGFGVYF